MSRLRAVSALFLAAALVAGCSNGTKGVGHPRAGEAAGRDIPLGMINMENSPLGSFPEVRQAAQAAVSYVNRELGGARGRRLRLDVCTTTGTPESSQACANRLLQKKPVAVIGGVDFGSSQSLSILEQAHVPYVGGSPTLPDELLSPDAFMFSGGTAAELLAEAGYFTDTLHARRVSLLYVDLPGLLDRATSIAKEILQKKGVTDVRLGTEKADAADFTPALSSADQGHPDAIAALFPAQGCSRVMQATQALGIKAKMFYPGACAEQTVVDAAGHGAEGAYFATGYLPFTSADGDVATYRAKMRTYAGRDAKASVLSQAGFSVVMNLHRLLGEIDGPPTPASLVTRLRATRDQPSFMGHPYTCDGARVPLLSAVCSAEVRILQYRDGRFEDLAGDWVNGTDLIKLVIG